MTAPKNGVRSARGKNIRERHMLDDALLKMIRATDFTDSDDVFLRAALVSALRDSGRADGIFDRQQSNAHWRVSPAQHRIESPAPHSGCHGMQPSSCQASSLGA